MIPDLTTDIIKSLLLPPGSLLLLLLIGFLYCRRSLGRMFVIFGLLGLYLSSIDATSDFLARQLETYPATSAQQLQDQGVQAIVVLGGGRHEKAPESGGEDTLSAYALERLSYAVLLHRQTGLPIIVTGGSVNSDGPPEAEVATKTLDSHFGLTPIAIETQSLNSRQHGQYLRPMLNKLNIDRIAVVTHAWHIPRSMLSFEQSQIHAFAAPVGFISKQRPLEAKDWLPNAAALLDVRSLLHEYLGLAWYELTGPGTTP